MARKKQQDSGPAGSPAWMSTFSDLMNLLLCFFVLLFSMSTVDAEKFEEIAASMQSSFSIFDGGAASITEGGLISSGISQLAQLSQYYQDMSNNPDETENNETTTQEALDKINEAQLQATEELKESIQENIDKTGLNSGEFEGNIDMDITSQYVTLTLNGSILYNSGSASLKPDAIAFVDKLGDVLKLYGDNDIEIRGYTDSVPMVSSGKYTDNMELSQGRAYSVYKYLIDQKGMSPQKLQCSGRGEQDPVASNDTAEGRALNRRVEIRIYSILDGE